MAAYYDYDDYYDPHQAAFDPPEHFYSDYSYDTDHNQHPTEDYQPAFFDPQKLTNAGDSDYCDAAHTEYDVPREEYTYEYEHQPRVFGDAEYTGTENAEAGGMEIAYGEPGYWEEYQHRTYEIIYGSDSGEDQNGVVPAEAVEVAFDAVALCRPYDENDAAQAVCALSVEEDEARAWEVMWERGPLIGEDELAWAETMEEWRQRIQADEERAADDPGLYGSAPEELCVHGSPAEQVEEPLVGDATPQTLEELQAAYDRGDILEENRGECARLLGELWACELEDQRLLAAGYVWDEELGDYVHSAEINAHLEYDSDEDDFTFVHAAVSDACDVHHLAEIVPLLPIALAPSSHVTSCVPQQLFSRPLKRTFRSNKSKPTTRPFFHRIRTPPRSRLFVPAPREPLLKPQRRLRRLRARPSRSQQRELPPHIAASTTPTPPTSEPLDNPVSSIANVAAMVPAPSATPPPVVDETRCSLGTVPFVAADILARKEPVPPDIRDETTVVAVSPSPKRPLIAGDVLAPKDPVPTDIPGRSAVALASPPSKDSVPDAVLIPRLPEPPNICVDTLAITPTSVRTSITDSAVSIAVPKPPNLPLVATVRLKSLSASAQRRRNAQRRIAKKGKG
ncbi:hypothetical protein DFH09DRAFT_1377801 [Mycena vulgaris]|nr:hypothetical protein DFH09DRAFT_1377801 [Mycena vulgaris]